jgi:hypothetical protein
LKISDRFTDYGLIGGFFWLLQFGIWFIRTGADAKLFLHSLQASYTALPQSSIPVLGAMSLVLVFVTGMLLDIFGTRMLRNTDLVVFAIYFKSHQSWFTKILDANDAFIQQDYSILQRVPPTIQVMFPKSLARKLLGKRYMAFSAKEWKTARIAFHRIHSFMISYLFTTPGVDKMEVLATQISLWNAARAISFALIIWTGEAFWCIGSVLSRATPIKEVLLRQLFTMAGFILAAGASFIAMSAYERFCENLFAFVYVISEREARRSEANESAPSIAASVVKPS